MTDDRSREPPPKPSGACLLAVLMGLAAFALYVATRARFWDLPTVFAMDGAELVVAARDLGVDHPPGHPLYLILGFLFSKLPFSQPEGGVIFLSAVAGSASVGLVWLGALEITGKRIAALAASLVLGLAGIFWLHSAIVEVYALQTMLVALLVWLAARGMRRGRPDSLAVVTFAWGLLATCNILLAVLVLAPVAVYLAGARVFNGDRQVRRRRVVRAAAALVAGLVPLLYIPWRILDGRSFINDLVFFGGYTPLSPRWLAWYFSGWEFVGERVGAYGMADYPRLLWQYIMAFGRHLSPLSLLFAVAGLIVVATRAWKLAAAAGRAPLTKREQKKLRTRASRWRAAAARAWQSADVGSVATGVMVLVGFVVTAAPVIGYEVPDREVFYLPSFVFAAYLVAIGFGWVLDHAGRSAIALTSACVVLIAAWNAWHGWVFVHAITADRATYEQHSRAFEALPAHAVIVAYDEGVATRYRYFQMYRGLRPDMAIESLGKYAPRYHGALPTSGVVPDETALRAGLNMADRIAALNTLARRYTDRPLLLAYRDDVPAEFPGFRAERSSMDPRLLVLTPKRPIQRSATPIPDVVSVSGDPYPADVRFVSWGLSSLDQGMTTAFTSPLPVDGRPVNGLIGRGELFELSFVVQRLGHDTRPYFAEFAFLDSSISPIKCGETGFVGSRQVQVLDEETSPGFFRKDSFESRVPRACAPGMVTLAVRLYAATDETTGTYQGRPVKRMHLVPSALPWAGQTDFHPLGEVLIR
jgi:4-amino-4-deoxy-L-arabinose transferase-like glycosyltransferase